ncbi:MAG: hypothetical protein Q7U04_06210 [Bacteriovorax sp.]|nr:hypothetical protein [Bacteriovorax sp.]
MNFQTEYKNINFNISLEIIDIKDVTLLLGDKFNKLPNQTMIELKKGSLVAYNLIIKSTKENKEEQKEEAGERTHFWGNVLLTSKADELVEELGYYLEDEEILDAIVANWLLAGDESGPAWK